MRINIYSQEITNEFKFIRKDGSNDNGDVETFEAVRLMLHSPDLLHFTEEDDDRSGVTFWLPKSEKRRKALADTFHEMAVAINNSVK